ncbi:hypothetical protein HSEST_2265 [Halapricum desulfuricans]|uniref:Uncharacterized protein n=1 Tax=Halapricum desulfuricans TaxID=2841257 RepID=A0A897NSJ4_9EURY|nr:hypothetical protein HSEST_2265 [Halapricum desulfuricans]
MEKEMTANESRIRVLAEQLAELNELERAVYGSETEVSHNTMLIELIDCYKEQNNL